MDTYTTTRIGATPRDGDRCDFLVWAPSHDDVAVRLEPGGPDERVVTLERRELGYHAATVDGVRIGARYRYRLGDGPAAADYPDPASRSQPDDVHGASEVIAHDAHSWADAGWRGRPLAEYVIYELHVGTFTAAGTFDAAIGRLDDLVDLGVTAVEIMPIAQFPGPRNWGYDGVYPFAIHRSYGGREAFARLVDACHARRLAVVLDVVYNHLGPEGNYLSAFGPYFTDRYRTPWGDAVNFDGAGSDEVRRYFIESAIEHIADLHVDALRLDAVHAIVDTRPRPFLAELGDAVHELGERLGRQVHVIAESDANDRRLVTPRDRGGLGLDAVWADDLHHSLHALLTGEQAGYYADYGDVSHLARALRRGFTYTGQRSAVRGHRHGSSTRGLPAERFVVSAQNHDQIGNRVLGERLSQLVDLETQKLAAAIVLLSPFVPLLFMGEEYGETAPFPYFVSHHDPALVDAVRRGRASELAGLQGEVGPPDPAAPETFERARLQPTLATRSPHTEVRALYRALIALRRSIGRARGEDGHAADVGVVTRGRALRVVRHGLDGARWVILLHFGEVPRVGAVRFPRGDWTRVLDTAARAWAGPGGGAPEHIESSGRVELPLAARSAVVYTDRESRPPRGTR